MVDHERPDLQEHATALVRQLAEYTITLKELEDNLLARCVLAPRSMLQCMHIAGSLSPVSSPI